MSTLDFLALDAQEFRAVRDSGVVGPDLVTAATAYLESTRRMLEITNQRRAAVSEVDVRRAESAVAEAEYWLEEAKFKR